MPFKHGDFQKDCKGAYKFDGKYLMPYRDGEYQRMRNGTYKINKNFTYPFLMVPIIEE